MFYSHQLLARKAPLGQIWMAATMHPKINRRKLDKLDIIQICEEILNPSVPMALRLSGILMGGVVIVYERKVKLLYDDVTRLLVELNHAWKVKAVSDPTVLPKEKSQAKYEAITLPENEAELREAEQTLQFTESATMMGFQQTSYIAMRLDDVDEPLISHNPREEEEDPFHHYHQADAANITLSDHFDTYQADTDIFNRFERFDIIGDEETHLNLNSPQEQTEIPTTLIPSPVIQQEAIPPKPAEIQEQHPEEEDHLNQQSYEVKEANQPQQDERRQRRPPQKRARRVPVSRMDYEQTIIPGHMYQSWLQDASDLKRVRKRKHIGRGIQSTMKIADLMELPSLVLIDGLFDNATGQVHYPAPLLKLSRMTSVQPPLNSPSGRPSPPQQSSSSSPPERFHYQDPVGFPFEEIHNGVGARALEMSTEKQRTTVVSNNNKMSAEKRTDELKTNFMNNDGVTVTDANVIVTPGNSGNEVRSVPSSGSAQGFVSINSGVNSGRLKKRQYSSPHGGGGSGLEPVAEENSWPHSVEDPNFKLPRLSENALAPENDLMVETGPTQQTQNHPTVNQSTDQITESIRTQLKMHFETPESSQQVSLNQLASGMNKKRAACLFYQTCVLATREYARVEQKEPYGDILISKGAKM